MSEPLGREARALEPWTEEERSAFTAYCREHLRCGPENAAPRQSVDWLRQHRNLPPLPPLPQPTMKWESGQYGGRKSIRDLEVEAQPAADGFVRPCGLRR